VQRSGLEPVRRRLKEQPPYLDKERPGVTQAVIILPHRIISPRSMAPDHTLMTCIHRGRIAPCFEGCGRLDRPAAEHLAHADPPCATSAPQPDGTGTPTMPFPLHSW
jgi:hypothetical protein